jgi:hypothetical protein
MTAEPSEPAAPSALIRFAEVAGAPIEMRFVGCSLEVLLVDREMVPREADAIPKNWALAGVYVLLGPPTKDGPVVRARPGFGNDVLKRLREHPKESPWFRRALLACDREAWESGHARYLEGRLHDLCRANALIDHDFRRDGDKTLKPHTEAFLERQSLAGIIGALMVAGVPIEPTWQ